MPNLPKIEEIAKKSGKNEWETQDFNTMHSAEMKASTELLCIEKSLNSQRSKQTSD
jgi:hypothetical protein